MRVTVMELPGAVSHTRAFLGQMGMEAVDEALPPADPTRAVHVLPLDMFSDDWPGTVVSVLSTSNPCNSYIKLLSGVP